MALPAQLVIRDEALSDAPEQLMTTDRFVTTVPNCNDMIDPEGATLSYGYGSVGAEDLWTLTVEHADYIVTSKPFAQWYIPPEARLRSYVTTNFRRHAIDRKSTRLNSSHLVISYAVFCLKKKR